MRKIGYIRTSTHKQLIDRQVNQLKTICDEIFVEDGVSALRKHRPIYNQAVTKLAAGDVLVVPSLDRAYRSSLDALKELEKLHERNIDLYSVTQNFDTRTPEGKLLFALCAALAEFEVGMLSNRTKEGMEAARRTGSKIGRPKKLYHNQIVWKKNDDGFR